MTDNDSAAQWDRQYLQSPPWVIDEPQPTVVELTRAGTIRGKVLDVGCGSGDNALFLAESGCEVLGVDVSAHAVTLAQRLAVRRKLSQARFLVADVLHIDPEPRYDTVLDSALFHTFDTVARARYIEWLGAVCRVGGTVVVLCLGANMNTALTEAFEYRAGWELEALRVARYRGRVTAAIAARAQAKGWPGSGLVDVKAWLAVAHRIRA
ncbi:class I SAM-dependent methyltransferase [Nocardia sp. CY41]|uniref:class I SAM-dependent methyltransferase n=1 Tax=Nocardia sp. CY41 TaxID=2608686 RepID=UPI001359AC83|nr:class I SAM-dependent methyltransferase [Nocardia sp. CY41]